MSEMRGVAARATVRGPEATADEVVGSQEIYDLWFAISRREWSSLVIVPVNANGTGDELARSLASVGKHLSEYPVSALPLKMIGPASVRALAALVLHFRRDRPLPAVRAHVAEQMERIFERDAAKSNRNAAHKNIPLQPLRNRSPVDDDEDEGAAANQAPAGQLIISIPSILSEPVGIAVARAADAVVLAVELGHTRLADTRRTIEAIGRERILGTCLVRRGGPAEPEPRRSVGPCP